MQDIPTPEETDKKWIPIDEAAQMLDTSKDELYRLAMKGHIAWVFSAGNWLLSRDEIEWMAANTEQVEAIKKL